MENLHAQDEGFTYTSCFYEVACVYVVLKYVKLLLRLYSVTHSKGVAKLSWNKNQLHCIPIILNLNFLQ